MNLISTMLGFIGRKIKSLETEVGKINSTLDDVSPAPKVIPIERGGTGCTTIEDTKKTFGISTIGVLNGVIERNINLHAGRYEDLKFSFPDEAEAHGLLNPIYEDGIQDIYSTFHGIVEVDFSLNLGTEFEENANVKLQLFKLPKSSDEKVEIIKFKTRTTMQNPDVHFVGSTVLSVKPGDSFRFKISTNATDGNISGDGGNPETASSRISLLAIKTN